MPPVIVNAAFEENEDGQGIAVSVQNIDVDIAALYAKSLKKN